MCWLLLKNRSSDPKIALTRHLRCQLSLLIIEKSPITQVIGLFLWVRQIKSNFLELYTNWVPLGVIMAICYGLGSDQEFDVDFALLLW